MAITEADDYTSPQQAYDRYLYIRGLYNRGEETMGVLQMYENAARKAGALPRLTTQPRETEGS